jgi:type I restriction enzyme S subunit
VFRINKELVFPKYLHHLHRTKLYTGVFETASTGVIKSRLRLYPDKYLALKTALPKLQDQIQIARYLDWKTSQIAKFIKAKKRLIELLKEQKQVIINDAVTGKIDVSTGRPYPKYKDSGVEWLGKIPVRWEGRKLKTFCSVISKGTTPSTEGKNFVDSGIRFIKAENISNGKLNSSPAYFIDNETNFILKRSQLAKNDILIVIAGATIGKVAVLHEDFLPANTNQAVCFLRLDNALYLKEIYYVLQSQYIKSIISLFSVQSAQPNLAMGVLENFVIPTPPNEETSNIIAYIERNENLIETSITKIQSEIAIAQEYLKCLIVNAVTGKVDVRNVKIPEFAEVEMKSELEEALILEEEIKEGTLDIDR